MSERIQTKALHEALAEHFSLDELKLLCHDAGTDPETVPYGERSKDIFAFCIVGAFRRQDRLAALLRECARARPSVNWADCRLETAVPAEWAELFTPQNLINTQGGAAFVGTFTVTGDIVGRDKVTITEETAHTVGGLPNPYLGLRPFTYADRDAYAGQARAVDEAVTQLTTPGQQRTILFVTGASGSGKSSFAQAGLLPALEAHYAARGQRVRKAVFRPGAHPTAMREDARLQLAAQQGGASPVDVIIVDQFEELFTQSQPDEREAVFAWLTNLPNFDQSRTHVIATLRSDYLKELFDAKPVWDISKRDGVELRAMTVDELKEAIQRPLQAKAESNSAYQGKRFEPALLDRLAQDASASPTLLPLLQVTLEELWKKGRLALANYGTLTDAIRARADQVLAFKDFDAANPNDRRSPTEQTAVLATCMDFVTLTLDEGPRQARVSREKTALSPDKRRLVDDLVRARLLSVTAAGKAETVSIIHESLIANWGRLQEAVRDERERLQQRTRFEEALRAWEAEGKAKRKTDDYLLTGVWLAQARVLEEQKDIVLQSESAKVFLRKSVEQEVVENKRELAQARRRALVLSAALGLAILAALAALAFLGQSQQNAIRADASAATAIAERNRANDEATVAKSRGLGAQALANQERNLDLSFLLSVEAQNVTRTFEAKSDLLDTLQHSPRLSAHRRGHTSTVSSVIFSPAGQTMASGGGDIIVLWDVRDPKAPKAISRWLAGNQWNVTSLVFSPDGKILASAGGDIVVMWDVRDPASPKPIGQSLVGHRGLLNGVAFSPDGKTLASGGSDSAVILWDVRDPASPERIGQPLTGHEDVVFSVAFSSDGKTLASGGADNAVILWDVQNPASPERIGQPLTGHEDVVFSVAFSSDGKTLASGGADNAVILWDVQNPASPKHIGQPLTDHTKPVTSVAFSPDGKTLASGSGDATVILWDVRNPASPKSIDQSLTGHTNVVASVAFTPDGKTLASGSADATMILWDVRNPASPKSIGQSLIGHRNAVTSVAFSPDGKTLASGGADNTVILWDVSKPAAPKPIGEPLKAHTDSVWSVAFSPNGKTLASASADGSIILWALLNPASPKPIGHLRTDQTNLWLSIAFSPDGRTLASGDGSVNAGWGKIGMWDVLDPTAPKLIGVELAGPALSVTSVTFSPDGQTLASGVVSGSIYENVLLWDVRDRANPKRMGMPLAGHMNTVTGVAFSPDSQTLASGSFDATVILWDVRDPVAPRPIGQPLVGHTSTPLSVAFSPDGKTLASGSADNTVILWNIDLDSWMRRACHIVGRNLTKAEWQRYIGDEPYRKTCEEWPEGA